MVLEKKNRGRSALQRNVHIEVMQSQKRREFNVPHGTHLGKRRHGKSNLAQGQGVMQYLSVYKLRLTGVDQIMSVVSR
jgi:hypothetical protein